MKTKLAIFDIDGTLIDTCRANYEAYTKAIIKATGRSDTDYETFCRESFGKNYKEFLPDIMKVPLDKLESVHNYKAEYYEECLKSYSRVNTGLLDIINGIKDSYYLAVVSTSSKNNAKRALDMFLKDISFDLIVCCEDVKNLKPDTEGLELAISFFGVKKENVIYFDDNIPAVKSAKAFGISTYLTTINN